MSNQSEKLYGNKYIASVLVQQNGTRWDAHSTMQTRFLLQGKSGRHTSMFYLPNELSFAKSIRKSRRDILCSGYSWFLRIWPDHSTLWYKSKEKNAGQLDIPYSENKKWTVLQVQATVLNIWEESISHRLTFGRVKMSSHSLRYNS